MNGHSVILKKNIPIDQLIALVSANPYSFFLDSSDLAAGQRYSYFSYRPQSIVDKISDLEIFPMADAATSDVCWQGGYLGVVLYSGSCQFAFYPIVLVYDAIKNHFFATSSFCSQEVLTDWVTQLEQDLLGLPTVVSKRISSQWLCVPEYHSYLEKFNRVYSYLQDGDVYQINLTCPFRAKTSASAAQLYQNLREQNPSPYAAFIHWQDSYILSASPELFFRIDGSFIHTKPIKGTRRRLLEGDEAIKAELLDSEKDRAELLMITDLERNDLGRICQTGTIKVTDLCSIETFATVHHLVSTIQGQLYPNMSLSKVFSALFPGGSVTGAPKIRAMEIIKELETYERGVYTGAIGFVGSGQALFNLPIRTMIYKDGVVDFSTGGGIVIDSTAASEFEELWWKAEGMMKALGLKRPE